MEKMTPAAEPFAYPPEPHRRRHGPAGYSKYQQYRPWLEDEFTFRCVYCLKRMVWSPTDVWSVDHVIPQDEAKELACEYDNLVLACQCCNRMKSNQRVPDPGRVAYGQCLHVESDGSIKALNQHGRRLVRALRLNEPRYQQWRSQRMRELSALALCDPQGLRASHGVPRKCAGFGDVESEGKQSPARHSTKLVREKAARRTAEGLLIAPTALRLAGLEELGQLTPASLEAHLACSPS